MAKTKVKLKAVAKNITKSERKQQTSKTTSSKDLLKTLSKPMTQTQQLGYLAQVTNLTKKETSLFIKNLLAMIAAHLKKTGLINLAGLMKIYLIKKSATKAREAINPLTGQLTLFKAKPARKVVRIRPLKKLKEII